MPGPGTGPRPGGRETLLYSMHTSLCESLTVRLTSAGNYLCYSLPTLFPYPADDAEPLQLVTAM